MDVHRAVRANLAYLPLWYASMPQVLTVLGFTDSSPTEYGFADAVAKWQRSVVPALKSDGILGPMTWQRMKNVIKPPPSPPPPEDIADWGPQSFAPAQPGTIPIDPQLHARNRLVEQSLFSEAKRLSQAGDFRWFFTLAHAHITRQINQSLLSFERPNALLLLNLHFSEEYLRALRGLSHERWREVFHFCEALEKNAQSNAFLVGEVEFCGAKMANVHIHVDLADALNEVGCIPPDDYSAVLSLVNRGALAATIELRGKFLGVTETIANQFIAPLVNLEVKAWRNTVYEQACNAVVPDQGTRIAPAAPGR
jgi:hypothetical protein